MKVQPFVEAEKVAGHSVKRCCELLEVSRAAFYQRLDETPSRRQVSNTELLRQIMAIFEESDGTYGSPRVHRELRDRGICCGKPRVARFMRQAGLEGRCKRRWRKTTIQDPEAESKAIDLIRREFGTGVELDTRYCGDITYIWTWEGWAYLATVIDLDSRRVVRWALDDHMRTELVGDALKMAFATRRPGRGVIFHSDRGCQYTSKDYRELADNNGVRLSLGRKGECWDNAVAESFFATLKRELVDRRNWPTRAGLHRAVFSYIEGWYNTRRLHSSLDYRSPAQYEATIRQNADRQAA